MTQWSLYRARVLVDQLIEYFLDIFVPRVCGLLDQQMFASQLL